MKENLHLEELITGSENPPEVLDVQAGPPPDSNITTIKHPFNISLK